MEMQWQWKEQCLSTSLRYHDNYNHLSSVKVSFPSFLLILELKCNAYFLFHFILISLSFLFRFFSTRFYSFILFLLYLLLILLFLFFLSFSFSLISLFFLFSRQPSDLLFPIFLSLISFSSFF